MTVAPPPPDPGQLIDALESLEADLNNSAMPLDKSARAVLLERVRRIRARACEAITSDPAGSTATILALLDDWVQVLALLRRLDLEGGSQTRH
jgi:hypothetical protein